MHDFDEKMEVHIFKISILRINTDRPFPSGGFEYVEDISIFTHDFIINYCKFSVFGSTLIVDADYPEC